MKGLCHIWEQVFLYVPRVWSRVVKGCVYAPFILPLSSLYALCFAYVFQLWSPVIYCVPLTGRLDGPRGLRPQYSRKPAAGALHSVYRMIGKS